MNHYDAVTVNGVLLRLAMAESKLWVRRTDFAKALKYSSSAVDNQLLKVEIEHCKKMDLNSSTNLQQGKSAS